MTVALHIEALLVYIVVIFAGVAFLTLNDNHRHRIGDPVTLAQKINAVIALRQFVPESFSPELGQLVGAWLSYDAKCMCVTFITERPDEVLRLLRKFIGREGHFSVFQDEVTQHGTRACFTVYSVPFKERIISPT